MKYFQHSFIDFDHTLYRTYEFTLDIYDKFKQYGVSEADFKKYLSIAVHGETGDYYNYTFELHVDVTKQAGLLNEAEAEELLRELYTLSGVNYQDPQAQPFLEYVQSVSERLYLLTAGSDDFQKQKLATTNLAGYFDEIVICRGDKDAVVERHMKPDDRILFVNDNIAENIVVKHRFPSAMVITRKHPIKYTEEELRASTIPYFTTLNEIKTYVDRSIA